MISSALSAGLEIWKKEAGIATLNPRELTGQAREDILKFGKGENTPLTFRIFPDNLSSALIYDDNENSPIVSNGQHTSLNISPEATSNFVNLVRDNLHLVIIVETHIGKLRRFADNNHAGGAFERYDE